jgi:2-iminoacetate synthase
LAPYHLFPTIERQRTPFIEQVIKIVNDADFRKAIVIIRLAVPYTGIDLTARENAKLRRELILLVSPRLMHRVKSPWGI